MLRLLRTPLTLTAALLGCVVLAPPAIGAQDRAEVVGGERLAGRDVIVGAGAPVLPEIGAASWLVADLDTGQVLAAKDPHGRYAPASALKVLTALTLIPVVEATRPVVPTFQDVGVEGTKVGIVERVSYPASELFAAMLMVSGNDAASALATSAGGQQATAALMNDKARELGALDTVAVNPHGLDATGQVSSAYDLALITRAGLQDADLTRYLQTRSSSVNGPGGTRIATVNKNKLLKDYPGTLGGKNGFTTAARASYVGAAARGNRRLVVSVMRSTPKVFDEAAKLFDWGFAAPGAPPIGELVRPADADAPVGAALPTVPASRPVDRPGSAGMGGDGTGVTVTLAGAALAAAAVLCVRRSPASRRSAARRVWSSRGRSKRKAAASARRVPADRAPADRPAVAGAAPARYPCHLLGAERPRTPVGPRRT